MDITKNQPKTKILFLSFSRQETEEEKLMLKKLDGWVNLSENIFPLKGINVTLENAIDPKYNFNNKTLFLPYSYSNVINKQDTVYFATKKQFGDLYQDFIAYHEIGHAIQHNLVNNGQIVDIKEYPQLNYLFNGATIPNKINNFLQEIFKESYADCYAALCLYKKTNDISVFDKSSIIRENRYHEMKQEFGIRYIHPNFNYTSTKILGDIIKQHETIDSSIFDLTFSSQFDKSIEKLIEHSVLKGCINTIHQELSINDNFLNHFIKFSKEFKISSYNKQILCLLNSSNNKVVSFFTEFQKRCGDSHIIGDMDIIKVINNTEYNRNVSSDLVLMDVKNIPYSAGLEKINIHKHIKNLKLQYIGTDYKTKYLIKNIK